MAKPRRTADPEITTCSLEVAIEEYLREKRSRDLASHLALLSEGVSWKSAPKVQILAAYSDLYSKLATLCPNGVLPSKKLAWALEAADQTKPANFGSMTARQWSSHHGKLIRAWVP